MKDRRFLVGAASCFGLLVVACGSPDAGAGAESATRSAASKPGASAQPPPHQGPPPEAIEACKASSDGADCTVALEELSIAGKCRKGPHGEEPLVCVPKHLPPPGMHHGPPPEAIEACKASADGAACTVALEEHSITGTCRKGPHGEEQLVCVPKDFPPPGAHHGPPPEALSACKGLGADAACEVKLEARKIEGKCRSGPAGQGPLACVPKDFPPPPPPPRED